ncbi:MAG: hypothetical protein F6J90_00855 [Moorea sp. SIOASIH]|nr:hypothetical protein [Moorena sp. SIOASIH]NEO91754.1 hypothetical protein [Moorena sp. SIO3G5]
MPLASCLRDSVHNSNTNGRIFDAIFPTPDSRLPTPDSRLPIPFAIVIQITPIALENH